NQYPTQTLTQWTLYRKNKKYKDPKFITIHNYQVSHIFGRTKNPILFTALWNIAYVPKYLDPFTGHETKGEISDKLRPIFQSKMKEKLNFFIDDYNKFIAEKIKPFMKEAFEQTQKSNPSISEEDFLNFKQDAENELSQIQLEI